MLVFGHGSCFGAKVVVFGQMWLYSGKYGCIRAKVVVFRKSGCIPANSFNLGKVVVIGQSGCIWAKVVFIGQKWLYLE